MKNLILILLSVFILEIKAQDSLIKKEVIKLRKNEIGLNILPIFIVAAGANSNYNDLLNLTYRRMLNNKHALRLTSGIYFKGNDWNTNPMIVSKNTTTTVYQNNNISNGVNIQHGFGYEYIMGKRKLKHVLGCDITYNYQKSNMLKSYFQIKDSMDANNNSHQTYMAIDTGATSKSITYHKFGANLFYSLRYPLGKKWLITASTILSYQVWRTKEFEKNFTVSNLNINGLVSEVSLFYRF